MRVLATEKGKRETRMLKRMEMIEKILEAGNLTKACKEVVKNKGAGGVDKMPVKKLKAFFDEVDHVLLLQLMHRKVKCKATMRLLRRWLRAPIEIEGKLVKRRKGVPQGSPISPFLSNVMLNELDKEMAMEKL
jgi:retron-type reverse transcriptase